MADEGKSQAAALAASLPPPDKLLKGESGGGGIPPVADPPIEDDVDPGKMLALEDFEAAAPGSPERLRALEDLIYMCVQKHKDGG